MRVLFFDDDHRRHKHFKRGATGHVIDPAYGVQEAIRLLSEHHYDAVFLDHDMSEDPDEQELDDYESGLDVALWIADNPLGRHDCRFIIHSLNELGAMEMMGILRSAGLDATQVRWSWKADLLDALRPDGRR